MTGARLQLRPAVIIVGTKYTFSGAPTHQMTPWNGRNALTAMNLLFTNIDAVRPSIRPEARIQGYIMEGGTATTEELIKGTERGILVSRLWYIRMVDPQTLLLTGLSVRK